jgi:hypothetical protein
VRQRHVFCSIPHLFGAVLAHLRFCFRKNH